MGTAAAQPVAQTVAQPDATDSTRVTAELAAVEAMAPKAARGRKAAGSSQLAQPAVKAAALPAAQPAAEPAKPQAPQPGKQPTEHQDAQHGTLQPTSKQAAKLRQARSSSAKVTNSY